DAEADLRVHQFRRGLVEPKHAVAETDESGAVLVAGDEAGELRTGFEGRFVRPELQSFGEQTEAAHTRATSPVSRSAVYSSPKPVMAAIRKTKNSSQPWKTNGHTWTGLTSIDWVSQLYSSGRPIIAA